MAKFAVSLPEKPQYDGLFKHYKSQGWNVDGTNHHVYGRKTKVYVDTEAKNITFSSTDKKLKTGVQLISWDSFSAITGATPAAARTATLSLNSSGLTATVNYDTQTVTVRDEVISFEVINELGDLLDA